jgi:hypothetical protein
MNQSYDKFAPPIIQIPPSDAPFQALSATLKSRTTTRLARQVGRRPYKRSLTTMLTTFCCYGTRSSPLQSSKGDGIYRVIITGQQQQGQIAPLLTLQATWHTVFSCMHLSLSIHSRCTGTGDIAPMRVKEKVSSCAAFRVTSNSECSVIRATSYKEKTCVCVCFQVCW